MLYITEIYTITTDVPSHINQWPVFFDFNTHYLLPYGSVCFCMDAIIVVVVVAAASCVGNFPLLNSFIAVDLKVV